MSDVQAVLGAYLRIHAACRPRQSTPAVGVALSEHRASILGHLDADDPVMVTELAEHLGVTPATASLNLKRLEADGLVRRDADPDDRRVRNVTLTELGRRARDAHGLLDAERLHDALGRLRPDERRRVLDGLALLADAADALVARGDEYVGALTGEVDR